MKAEVEKEEDLSSLKEAYSHLYSARKLLIKLDSVEFNSALESIKEIKGILAKRVGELTLGS